MHNLYAIFAEFLNICKQVSGNLVNESGNVSRRGVVPRFSDIEIVALNMTSEAVGIFFRSKRCCMGKKDLEKTPSIGYCTSQGVYYYGYKLHAVCGLSGVIHSFDLTKASVHDIHYLKDVKVDYSNCTVIGDRGYISAQVQLELFETANIRLEVPYRCNQKEWKPTYPVFAKARKKIETLFSQLCDQFMIIRNYAKDTDGLFARILGKISALTILQYINYKNERPIGRIKYALI